MNVKRNADELLIACLAAGMSMTKAAARCGLSLRTVQRRQKEPDFHRRVLDARQALVTRTTGQLAQLGPAAVRVLRQALRTADGKSRLAAAKVTLHSLFLAHQKTTQDFYVRELIRCTEELRDGKANEETFRRLDHLVGRPPAVSATVDDQAADALPPVPDGADADQPWLVPAAPDAADTTPPASPPPAVGEGDGTSSGGKVW
jgi:hypothetical protein